MKKILLFSVALLFAMGGLYAQRYAVIDSKYILEKMPEYAQAQQKLDEFARIWQHLVPGDAPAAAADARRGMGADRIAAAQTRCLAYTY